MIAQDAAMRRLTFAGALYEALRDSMREDPHLTVLGNWVFGLNFDNLMQSLRSEFPNRIVEPPVAEAALVALGVGAAICGVRTLVDLSIGSFAHLAWGPLVNEASVVHYLSNGAVSAPVVFHLMHGALGGGVQHSASPQAALWNTPGLEIVLPSSPHDAKGLMTRALKSHNPTIFVDHPKLMSMEGPVPEASYEIAFGEAEIKRGGCDVTLVATSLMVQVALQAAEALSLDGIDVEVIDPRTLVPFDLQTILESVSRTGRLVVLDETVRHGGVGAEIVAMVTEAGFNFLRAAPLRLSRADVPSPFSPQLGAALLPDASTVVRAIREHLKR